MIVRVRLLRHFIRLLAIAVLVPLIPVLYLSHFGFPRRVTERLVAAADREGYSLEAGKVRLDIWEGVVVDRIRLFRKGVLGPPIFEAEEVTVGFRAGSDGVYAMIQGQDMVFVLPKRLVGGLLRDLVSEVPSP